jgi:hypothetical protein
MTVIRRNSTENNTIRSSLVSAFFKWNNWMNKECIDLETLETPPHSIYSKTVIDEKIAGNIFPISKREFFYSAFDLEVYRILVKQDFEMIRNYESKLAEMFQQRSIKARVDIDDLKRYALSSNLYHPIPRTREVIMELTGKIHVTRSGRVVGFFQQQ